MERGDLSDDEWVRLQPFLPVSNGRCGRWRNHRQVGGRHGRTPGRNAVAELARPPGGGGAGGEGLSRSRGGFTSKLDLSADGRCRPLFLVVTGGQRADCTQFEAVLAKIGVPRLGPAGPRRKPNSLAADKAHSNGRCREYLRRRGIRHTIPEKTDSQAARLRKGRRGGRPPSFDEDRYRKRNTVERTINMLKQSRALATRYDWLLATTNAVTSSSARPPPQPWSSGSAHDRQGKT